MATTYTYSQVINFTNGLRTTQLQAEIIASAIVTSILQIDVIGDVVNIIFVSALSGGDVTILNAVVAAHIPYVIVQTGSSIYQGTSGTTTTFQFVQTANCSVTVPGITDTLMARTTTDTMINKTIVDPSDNVTARALWSGSGASSVSTYASTAPITGQVLMATSATTAIWQTKPTTFVDTTFSIYDVTDQTKNIKFDAAGTTGTSTTLLSSQTTNKTLTLPDATDTLVARATTDTLTNKTLTDNTNNVLSRGLWNGTGTGSVSTYTAAAPTTGQILVATTPSTATWQTLSSITPTTFVDTTFAVYDVTDNTKAIKLDAAGTTGTSTTLLSSQTTNKTLTLPDATDTLVARATTDTLTNKTLTDNTNNVISRQLWVGSGTGSVSTYAAAAPITGQVLTATTGTTATWQTPSSAPTTFVDTTFAVYDVTDNTKSIKLDAAGTTGTSTTLLSSQTTNKVLTLPDATDTLVARATTDTLTNKTLTDNTDNVLARGLWNGSGTGSVSTYAAAAPAIGQRIVATSATTATWQFDATTFVDTTFAIYDVTDQTKNIKFDAAGTTGTSTTLLSSQTTNKTLTLPDATDTLVARATTDTLTNKTLTDNTNNVLARGLWNGTGTGSVSTYAASAPITGQILVATTPSTATWQSLSSITPTTFVDSTFAVYDVTNNTISIKLDAAGTTGTSTTLLSSQTTNKVLTLPDATDTLVGRATTDILTNKTLTDNTNNILARGLWNGSGTGSVSTYAAAAPTVGQRLVATSATTATWQSNATTFVDTTFAIYDVTDQTKNIKFDAAGTTGTSTTLLSSQTTNKVLTLPDATDTLVARATTDTLTNKTLTDNTNNVLARGLWVGSGTGSVSTYAATAPTTGQVLVATTSSTATWQTISTTTPTTFVDTTFAIYDVTDQTKNIKFDAAGTTGTSTTLLSSQTTNKVLTLPNATDTLVARSTTDTLTNKTLTDNTNNILARGLWVGTGTGSVSTYAAAAPTTGQVLVATTPSTATWQTVSITTPISFVDTTFAVYDVTDQTKTIKFDAAGTTGTSTTLLGSQTVNRILTLPNATDTLVARTTTDTLTNKTLTDNTNNILARGLWNGSGTGSVSTYVAAAPTTGQALIATSATTATWQTPSIFTLNTLTPQTQFLATGITGSDFNIVSSTATHTFNLPDAGVDVRGVVNTTVQTFTGAKTFISPSPVLAFIGATSAGVTNSDSITINVPSGTNANDMQMVAYITVRNGFQDVAQTIPYADTRVIGTPAAGWTLIKTASNATSYPRTIFIYKRTATNFEPVSYTWSGITPGPSVSLTASFTASFAGTTMNVSAVGSGTITTGQTITATGVTVGTTITAFGTGSGGTGSYTISVSSGTLTSRAVTATIPKTNMLVGSISTFSGASAYNTIDAEAAQATPSSLNHATPVVTTHVPNTLLLSYYTVASSITSWTVNGGMIQAANAQNIAPPAAIGESNLLAYKFQITPTSVGPFTATASNDGDVGITDILALRRTTAAILTVKGNISQSTDLIDLRDYNDNILSGFNYNGELFIGGSGATSNPNVITFIAPAMTQSYDLSIPAITDTLITRNTTDTLTNKTITSSTNNVISRALWNGSGTGSVSTYASPAPITGQILVATAPTTATWQNVSSVFPTTFVDTTFAIYDSVNNTIAFKFNAAGTAGTNTTFLGTQTANRILSLPDITDTIITRNTTDSLTNKSLTNNTNDVIARQLWVGSGAGSVSTYAATAPVTGQALIATSETTATWQVPLSCFEVTSTTSYSTGTSTATTAGAAVGTGTTWVNTMVGAKIQFVIYATGTASQSGTTITGVGTTFTTNMDNINGSYYMLFADGSTSIITGFVNTTTLTSSNSQTIPSQTYEIIYQANIVTFTNTTNLVIAPPPNVNIATQAYVISGYTTLFTTTSTSYILITGMTITPGNGTYIVQFGGNGAMSVATTVGVYALFNNGIMIPGSRRYLFPASTTARDVMFTQAKITITNDQTITVRAMTTVGTTTLSVFDRTLELMPVA